MSGPDHLERLWPESELDAALAAFRADVPTDDDALAAARGDLMAAVQALPGSARTDAQPLEATITHPRWRVPRGARRWIVGVAAVVVAALVAPSLPFGGRPPIDSAAAAVLTTAAAKIGASDQPLQPGQYRYLATHAWYRNSAVVADGKNADPGGNTFLYLGESVEERWVPVVWSQPWMLRTTRTGKHKWIVGTDQEAKAAGLDVGKPKHFEPEVARCGDFAARYDGREPCVNMPPGGWQTPTEQWIADLPRDPQQLLERLRADAPGPADGNGRGDVELLVYAADALRTGVLPADLRAALYRALALVPALRVVERSANLDGRIGTALGMNTDGDRHDIIIDPATGEFIGERHITTRAEDGFKPGDTTSYTAVQSSIVDKIGETGGA